jgi:ribosomal protein S18 acetylase RimI-like enzyme
VVATARHRAGLGRQLYQGLDQWMVASGAEWLRLGVVAGNVRGERFWESLGYTQTRIRENMPYRKRTQTMRVMYKPLAGGTLQQYLTLVPRDRPESQAP